MSRWWNVLVPVVLAATGCGSDTRDVEADRALLEIVVLESLDHLDQGSAVIRVEQKDTLTQGCDSFVPNYKAFLRDYGPAPIRADLLRMAEFWRDRAGDWTDGQFDVSSDADIARSDSVFLTLDGFSYGFTYRDGLDSEFRLTLGGSSPCAE